jgi:hypothetical protein
MLSFCIPFDNKPNIFFSLHTYNSRYLAYIKVIIHMDDSKWLKMPHIFWDGANGSTVSSAGYTWPSLGFWLPNFSSVLLPVVSKVEPGSGVSVDVSTWVPIAIRLVASGT